ncbi:hypothetical protein IWZ01DRAFT_128986 [Phyllosticta capitalensis]
MKSGIQSRLPPCHFPSLGLVLMTRHSRATSAERDHKQQSLPLPRVSKQHDIVGNSTPLVFSSALGALLGRVAAAARSGCLPASRWSCSQTAMAVLRSAFLAKGGPPAGTLALLARWCDYRKGSGAPSADCRGIMDWFWDQGGPTSTSTMTWTADQRPRSPRGVRQEHFWNLAHFEKGDFLVDD